MWISSNLWAWHDLLQVLALPVLVLSCEGLQVLVLQVLVLPSTDIITLHLTWFYAYCYLCRNQVKKGGLSLHKKGQKAPQDWGLTFSLSRGPLEILILKVSRLRLIIVLFGSLDNDWRAIAIRLHHIAICSQKIFTPTHHSLRFGLRQNFWET